MCGLRPAKYDQNVSADIEFDLAHRKYVRLSQALSASPMRKTLEISQLTHDRRLVLRFRHSEMLYTRNHYYNYFSTERSLPIFVYDKKK